MENNGKDERLTCVKAYVIELTLDNLVDESEFTPSKEYAKLTEKYRDLIMEIIRQDTILETLKVYHTGILEHLYSWKDFIDDTTSDLMEKCPGVTLRDLKV